MDITSQFVQDLHRASIAKSQEAGTATLLGRRLRSLAELCAKVNTDLMRSEAMALKRPSSGPLPTAAEPATEPMAL